jgi:uncharacterized protein YbaR (Trm112 family)
MVSQDLLDILRCPACVSGPTRRPGDDPGRLQLVKDSWLVCQEEGCGRKYPIRDDIPVMLIEEGDKYIDTPVEELAELPPEPAPPPPASVKAQTIAELPPQPFYARLEAWRLVLAVALLLTGLCVWLWVQRKR